MRKNRRKPTSRHLALFCFFSFFVLASLPGCFERSAPRTKFWIYTSLYSHVVEDFKARLARQMPEIDFQWYQSGSENVAAKINAELLTGQTQADLVMTSDLFWYEDLKEKGALLSYASELASRVPPSFKDGGGHWVTSRVPLMVIAVHDEAISEADSPKSFRDLALPKFKNKVSLPSPLESGTAFTTVALLSEKLGWDYFVALRRNGALAAGGNSAVMARLETKERPVAIVLLENVLAARKRNPKIRAIYPSEGLPSIPSPMAIFRSTKNPDLAKRVYDFFLSEDGQAAIVKGDMYSIFTDVAPPEGARPWRELLPQTIPWDMALVARVRAQREEIKAKFAKIFLE